MPTTLPPGTVLHERYRIERQIGQGGMGAVYEAVDVRLKRRVALKQLLIDGSYVSHAFGREAQLLANLDHPALPTVSDHFTDTAGQFLVMQYIPGDDLGTLLAQRDTPFPFAQVLDWAGQLLDALDYLHTQPTPILHRDIKPQNLKLKDRGQLMLLDFGLAKGSTAEMSRMTHGGSVIAHTPGFAPPEQQEGTGTDARSDLYALGATLHRLLTNTQPIEALTRFRALARQRTDPLRPVHELNPEVPEAVSRVLMQALELEPDDRPSSARAMLNALRAAYSQAGSTLATPAGKMSTRSEATILEPVIDSVPPARRRRKVLLGAGGILIAALLITISIVVPPIINSLSQAASAEGDPPATVVADAPTSTPTQTPQPPTSTQTPQLPTQTPEPPTPTSTQTPQPPTPTLEPPTPTQTPEPPTQAPQPPTPRPATAIPPTPKPTPRPATAVPPTPKPTPRPPTAVPATPAPPTAIPPTAIPPTPKPPTAVPPTPIPEPQAYCTHRRGQGDLFVGVCDGPVGGGAGSSCVQGKVVDPNGSPYQNAFLVVDNRGTTIKVRNYNPATGVYSQCGLYAGEWGIAVADFTRQGQADIIYVPASEQAKHQVRFLVSGPDEVFFVNFTEW